MYEKLDKVREFNNNIDLDSVFELEAGVLWSRGLRTLESNLLKLYFPIDKASKIYTKRDKIYKITKLINLFYKQRRITDGLLRTIKWFLLDLRYELQFGGQVASKWYKYYKVKIPNELLNGV